MMTSDWLLADDINDMTDDMVCAAPHLAFEHQGHVHFYSGPLMWISEQMLGVKSNHERALIWGPKHGAILIDNTRVGKFLINFKGVGSALITSKGTFKYFEANKRVPNEHEKNLQALAPWKHASTLFVMASWGHVTTTVCGASRDGVYYTLEVPQTINSNHNGMPIKDTIKALFVPRKKPIEFVNLIPFSRIAQGYTPEKWEDAHMMICRGEQRMALHEALDGVKPVTIREAFKQTSREVLSRPIEAYQYFLESQESYRLDLQQMIKETTARPRKSALQSPQKRQQKRESRLEKFGLMAWQLVKTEIDILPLSARPALTLPECLYGKVARCNS